MRGIGPVLGRFGSGSGSVVTRSVAGSEHVARGDADHSPHTAGHVALVGEARSECDLGDGPVAA